MEQNIRIVIAAEKSYLFKQAFELIIDYNIISKEKLLGILNINKHEAISLYLLKMTFLIEQAIF